MGKRGRPKGGTSKSCLIRDKLIEPYEIHIDEKNRCYVLYDTVKKQNTGYYVNFPALLKAIMEERYVPTGGDNNVYTLREYVSQMSKLRDAMVRVLQPVYHKL